MKTVVFAGPSIDRVTLRRITEADIANPIRRGDLEAWKAHDIFVVLDGEFAQSLSVSPKELLALLDAGKTVVGAASMGALRAAELARYGMIGVGWIYERFARADVRREDDVALTYSPVDFAPQTVPMVNVEYWMEQVALAGDISRVERALIVRGARKIFYADRTETRLRAAVEGVLGAARLESILERSAGAIPDIKAIDAARAVAFAARLAGGAVPIVEAAAAPTKG